jgi:5-methylcytosine-specific restriction endonuclease McrA
MAWYYGQPCPKDQPRFLERQDRKRQLEKSERECRRAVRIRDHGRCVVPACKASAQHAHHIVYRSRGGRWQSGNVCSLCALHHQMVHAALIRISGNADVRLKFEYAKGAPH